jgi:drug/metabolite transporter (DMT)-like permease
MNIKKIAGLVLLAVGIVFLAIRGFSYTKETHTADLGPLGSISVKEKERVSIPTWVGVVVAVAGAAILVLPSKK